MSILSRQGHLRSLGVIRGHLRSNYEILKSFVLIPKILDLSILFDYSSKQKVFYEFFGCFLIKLNKSYSCCFRQINKDESFSWVHYDCGKIVTNENNYSSNLTTFNKWADLISYCVSNGELPIMLFYQIQQNLCGKFQK